MQTYEPTSYTEHDAARDDRAYEEACSYADTGESVSQQIRRAARRNAPAPTPSSWTEERHGHTWTVTAWGYASRHCATGQPCSCQQPAAQPGELAVPVIPITRKPASRRTRQVNASSVQK